MGLSARRPQLPSLNLSSSNGSERKDILIEQFDFEDDTQDRTTDIVLGAHGAFRQDPLTPVTPLPGTPLVFEETPSYRSGTPVTPGFANGPNPFSFSFSQRSPSSSSHSSTSSPHLYLSQDTASISTNVQSTRSPALAESLISKVADQPALGLIPSFGTLNGLGSSKRAKGPTLSADTRQPEPYGSLATKWSDRELETLESFLLNPLRPLTTAYPPGTLPPSSALDELTSQIIHFHRPATPSLHHEQYQSETPKPGGMTSSRSAPSLKIEPHTSHAVGKSRHRRTHSSSGVGWKHSWSATRQKLYEVARKEAVGDSREDRFKGRSDIKKRALFIGAEIDSGPISPMPENMSSESSFDFGRQRDGHMGFGSHPIETGTPGNERSSWTATGESSQADNLPSLQPQRATRPISLLQRGKSFTAEDFDAAMTLNESANPTSQLSPMGSSYAPRQAAHSHVNSVHTTPPSVFARSQAQICNSSPPSSEGPRTPEAPPGITLTSPSPCGPNRNEQMKAMGSPTPGSDDRPGVFGALLDLGTAAPHSQELPRKKNRPAPLLRSRSTWDETQRPSMITQFLQGHAPTRSLEKESEQARPAQTPTDRTGQQTGERTPVAKRQKVQANAANLEE